MLFHPSQVVRLCISMLSCFQDSISFFVRTFYDLLHR